MSVDLKQLQADVKKWGDRNFPDAPWEQALMGANKEVGELNHSLLEQWQGSRGSHEFHEIFAKDAVGDIVLTLVCLCNRRGWDIEEVLAREDLVRIQDDMDAINNLKTTRTSWHRSFMAISMNAGNINEGLFNHSMAITDSLKRHFEQRARLGVRGVVIRLAGLCADRGWNLDEIVGTVWSKVRQRDFVRNPAGG